MATSLTAPPPTVATIEPSKPAADGKTPATASKPKKMFPHLGGGFIGYSAVASFIGWQNSYTYYNQLGAPWFLKAFSTTRLVMESGVFLTIFLVLGVLALAIVEERQLQARRIVGLSIGFGIVGLTLTVIGFIGSTFLGPVVVYRLSFAAIVLFALSTSFVVAGIVSGAMETGPRPVRLQLWATAILAALGLWRAPVLAGRARADRDAHPQLSALPFVVGPTAPADSGWRLVGILDRKFLMMKPAVRREDRRFRVTETFDAYTTSAAH
ncbi:MAG TPA: hypothetical protein VGN73_03110 [Gemmatimonadaceae bacterium]|jgi:hypothetical protein|nr:hypothetical protein [Gemmatimonadaceae bacterium]